MSAYKWIDRPVVSLTSTVGELSVAFTRGDHVAVDADGVTYRGQEYGGMVHLFADGGSGPWTPRKGEDVWLRRRSDYKDAPRTYAAAVVAAVVDAVRAYVAENPEVLRQAEYAAANNELSRLERERAEAAEKLQAVEAQIAAQVARLERSAPEGVGA